jgi:hypothetical protein
VSGDVAAALASSNKRGAGPEPIIAAVTHPSYPSLRAVLGVGVRTPS